MNNSLTYKNIRNTNLEKSYIDAQFQNVSYDKFESEDYITGYINGVSIEMSDVLLKKFTRSENEETVYTCIFSYSNISKNVHQEIRLRNNKNPSKIEKNKVELDSEDFEIVIKENKIYIRYEVGDIFERKIFTKSTNKQHHGTRSSVPISFNIAFAF